MNSYACIVMQSRNGAGQYVERKVLIQAKNAAQALRMAECLPGYKNGHRSYNGSSVFLVEKITSLEEPYGDCYGFGAQGLAG